MRRYLLAIIVLTLTTGAVMAVTITPGQGSLTDAAGHVWKITASGSITEDGAWTPGGGGTSALSIAADGTVYGQDAKSQSWLTLSGKFWSPAQAPPDALPTGPSPAPPPVPRGPGPKVATPVPGCLPTTPTGSFGILNGIIYDQNQQPFIARGINVMEGNEPSAAAILAQFPGTNFVRLAVYDYPSPAALSSVVNDYTSHGMVVEIEDHFNGTTDNAGGGQGQIFTGQQLAKELSWYISVSDAFKGNPAVWFGTNNEPPDLPGLSGWQSATYDAVRSTGSNAPVMIEVDGWADPTSFGSGPAYNPADYAKMTNTILDLHFYGWLTNKSTDQQVNNNFLAAAIANAQKNIVGAGGVMPVIIGEYGNATDGQVIDANAQQVVQAVAHSGVGSAAWAWGTGNPGDGLLRGDGYGSQVAGAIKAAAAITPTVSAAATCAGGTTVVAAADPLAPPSDPTPPTDAQIQMRSDMAQAQSDAAQVAQAAQVQATDTQAQVSAVMDKKTAVQDQIQQLLKRKTTQ